MSGTLAHRLVIRNDDGVVIVVGGRPGTIGIPDPVGVALCFYGTLMKLAGSLMMMKGGIKTISDRKESGKIGSNGVPVRGLNGLGR